MEHSPHVLSVMHWATQIFTPKRTATISDGVCVPVARSGTTTEGLVTLNHLVDFPGRKTHRHGSETSNYKTIRHISEFAVTWYGFVPMSAGRL